ncbi:MAG: hypothetical protein K2N35_07305 [Muribaculaceae bacterium]|nr:hypothetical protein [Muribaculaceae bacterium]
MRVATFAIVARLDNHVRVKGTLIDSWDWSFFNMVRGASVLTFGNRLIHLWCCVQVCVVTLSFYHTITRQVTNSLYHTYTPAIR